MLIQTVNKLDDLRSGHNTESSKYHGQIVTNEEHLQRVNKIGQILVVEQ